MKPSGPARCKKSFATLAKPPKSALLGLYLAASPLIRLFARRHLEKRVLRGKEDGQRYREKLGLTDVPRPDGPLVWMHAVGVGELLALPALIREMQARDPALNFLLTSSAKTSVQAIEHNLPPRTIHQFLPLDTRAYVRRFLDHWQPQLSVWAERDIWPVFLTEIERRDIPLALINGRMSHKSASRKQRAKAMFAALYAKFRFIEVQDSESAEGFASLGVPADKITVTGTLKAGADPLADQPDKRTKMEQALAGRPVWLAASTHPEDEIAVFKAQRKILETAPDTCLILAPRDPSRATRILNHALDLGFDAAILDGPDSLKDAQIAIINRIGELGLWFRLADRCFIGGSIAPVGGHNPYEPARLDCAITYGPNVQNFADDYAAFHTANAARKVTDGETLAAAMLDPALTDLRPAAAQVADAGRDAVVRTAERLLGVM